MIKKSKRGSAAAQLVDENRAVNAFINLARHCYAIAGELQAEAYVAHGVEALPAAEIVARAVGGRVYCDVVETPSFAERSARYDWHPTNLALLDHAFDSYLRSADGISAIGWALANELRSYGPPVTVIPNYRHAEEFQPSDEIREKCGLKPGDILLLAGSTICSGFEPVIDALRLLPENIHLATLGTIVKEYREKVHSYPAEIGVQSRVHFFDPVPYARLTTVASGANLGLMAIDPSLKNDRLSLPNRLFDCIAAGLPIVTPDVPDMARIVNERQIGVTVARNEAQCWAEAIRVALAGEKELRTRVQEVAKDLVWESLGDELHNAYGGATSVTILAYSDLIGHQRTMRMLDTLVKRGVQVTVCCPRYQQNPPEELAGVRFVFTPSPFSTATRPLRSSPPADVALERRLLEDLKKESLSLRYKARRYDELRAEIPFLGAQAVLIAPFGLLKRTITVVLGGSRRRIAAGRQEGPLRPLESTQGDAAPTSPAKPPQPLSPYEADLLEQLREEIILVRHKARRYENLKIIMPLLRGEIALFGALNHKSTDLQRSRR